MHFREQGKNTTRIKLILYFENPENNLYEWVNAKTKPCDRRVCAGYSYMGWLHLEIQFKTQSEEEVIYQQQHPDRLKTID